MKKRLLIILLLLLAGAGGFLYLYQGGYLFRKIILGQVIQEGVIEYEITYPTLPPSSLLTAGLPTKAYLRFKNNCTANNLSAMMGLVSITYISKPEEQKVIQTLNLINKKYVCEITSEELQSLNDSYIDEIKSGKNTMMVAGYKCMEAIAKLKNGETVHVYYTKDIDIKHPNWSNPYNKVDGVLMDFYMERYGLSMHLKAIRVLDQKIDDTVFQVDGEHKIIPFAEMEQILTELNPAR